MPRLRSKLVAADSFDRPVVNAESLAPVVQRTRWDEERVSRGARKETRSSCTDGGSRGCHEFGRASLARNIETLTRLVAATGMAAMKGAAAITTLFLDIGGVLLTDGWNRRARRRAAKAFMLDWAEMEQRHLLNFDTYEAGKLTLREYLARVVFFQKRPFTRAQFQRFLFAQSKPYPEMLELVRNLKAKYGLKTIVLSNEARELNAYRIRKFKLDEFVDAFVSSCYVHLHKPDVDIFRLALDIARTPARQIAYIENTPMFVQIAESLGMRGIVHVDYKSTCAKLAALGLQRG
jgi:putative hydrolase of the HAD superfamily